MIKSENLPAAMHTKFLHLTIELAAENAKTAGGGPFAAIIVKNGEMIATGTNGVTRKLDPTAHAEVTAIRAACEKLADFQLTDCILYSSCEPCPMCLGAIYWARLQQVFFACNRHDAAQAGFDDSLIYDEIAVLPEQRKIPMHYVSLANSQLPFQVWRKMDNKILY